MTGGLGGLADLEDYLPVLWLTRPVPVPVPVPVPAPVPLPLTLDRPPMLRLMLELTLTLTPETHAGPPPTPDPPYTPMLRLMLELAADDKMWRNAPIKVGWCGTVLGLSRLGLGPGKGLEMSRLPAPGRDIIKNES